MTNPNDTLFSDTLKRRIALERYSDRQHRETLKFLDQVKRDIIRKLTDGPELSEYSRRQQEQLLASVGELHRDIYREVNKKLDSEFDQTAVDQSGKFAGDVEAATGAGIRRLSATKAIEAARSRPLQGKFLKDWLTDLEPAHRARVAQALRISFFEGENISNATRRLREAVNISGNGLRTLIRTSNSHIASSVQGATMEANSDIVNEYEWRSTLDGRTTPICQSRDGQRYPVGKGPLPPAHLQCRSTTTAILKDFPPPQRVTYSEWLRGLPAKDQDDILGKKRGAEFRKGNNPIKDFVNPTSGRYKPMAPRTSTNAPKPPPPPPAPPPPSKSIRERVEELKEQAKQDVLRHGQRTGNEKLVAIDEATGEIYDQVLGSANRVVFSEKMIRGVNDPSKRILIHHNHPGGASLSGADINIAYKPGTTGIWAHGDNGSNYFATAPANPRFRGPAVADYIDQTFLKLDRQFQTLVMRGRMNSEERYQLAAHITMLIAEKKGLINYVFELNGSTKAAVEKFDYLIEEILKATPA